MRVSQGLLRPTRTSDQQTANTALPCPIKSYLGQQGLTVECDLRGDAVTSEFPHRSQHFRLPF